MNKKQLVALVDEMVADTAKKNGMTEDEARVFVGVAIRQNREVLTRVTVPRLATPAPPAPADTEDDTPAADAA